MQKALKITCAVLGGLWLVVATASATPIFTGDHAFIDNRPTIATAGYNDPLLLGLNLNLDVSGTDTFMTTSATAMPSSGSFPFTKPIVMAGIAFGPGQFDFGATELITNPSTQLAGLAGTYTFTVNDSNAGSAQDPSHNLSLLEILGFPTNFQFSDHSTTPTVTFTDPNAPPTSGVTRFYDWRVLPAGMDSSALCGNFVLSPTFIIPSGCLSPGQSYDFRIQINDALTADLNSQSIHDPTQSRSVGWDFGFRTAATVPEPSSFLLLGSGIAALAGLRRRKKG